MGYHCSQMIMILTLETIGEENPQLVKAMGGLGGGIGYCGDTCGCVWQEEPVPSDIFLGNLAPEEKEDAQMKPAVQELYQWFHKKTEEEFGAFTVRISLIWTGVWSWRNVLDLFAKDTYTKVMEILTERGVLEAFVTIRQKTKSVCPICMKVVPAIKCIGEDGIYLVKNAMLMENFRPWSGKEMQQIIFPGGEKISQPFRNSCKSEG